MSSDTDQILDICYHEDIEAFLDADWNRVGDTFDEGGFTGFTGADPTRWQIGYPSLAAYRDDWLRQAALFTGADRSDLRRQLYAVSKVAEVTITGDRALVRKEFDGTVSVGSATTEFAWITFYFLRSDAERWLITGFVGGLPLPGRTAPVLI